MEYTLRDKALSLPVGHPARTAYRNHVRGCANAREEVAAGEYEHGFLQAGTEGENLHCVTELVEAAIAETGVTLYNFTPSGGRIK